MRSPEQKRYEAIFRAIGRPVRNGLLLCIGTSILLAFAFGLLSVLLAPEFPPDWPRWAVFVSLIVPFGVALLVLPNLAQLAAIHGRTLKAIEAVNAFAIGESEQYRAVTGRTPPVLANVNKARRWLQRGEGHRTRVRNRLLIWAGELSAAAEVNAGLKPSTPADAFHQALLRQLIEYVATGRMDLMEPRELLGQIPAGPERDHAGLALAFEAARLDLERDGDPFTRLAEARAQLPKLPRGASIIDRFVVSLPASIGIFAVAATVVWVTGR